MTLAILFALALLAYAFTRMPQGGQPTWSYRFNWSQKLLGVVAFVVAVLILLNPEFLALGLFGDAAFFDFLVLLISLQLQTAGARVWHRIAGVFSRIIKWIVTPRLSYSLIRWTFASAGVWLVAAVASVASAIQKVVHRISS